MQTIKDTKVHLYAFPLSQPSRAIHSFLIYCHIPHEYHFIDLMKGQHMQPEFLAINPKHQVPAIKDYQITLTESTAIFRYLSRNNRHLVDENLYPIDIVRCAKVDEILDWYHSNLRKNSSGILFNRVFSKLIGAPQQPEDIIKGYETALEQNLQLIEEQYLKGSDYLVNNQLSGFHYFKFQLIQKVADFLLATEILALIQAGYNFSKNYKIKQWLMKMLKLNGFYQAHEKFFEMIQGQCAGIIAELTGKAY